ncbi:hypothetical protein PFISCL1PPCAC_3262, partial [Pristionchus fissidentatus]
MKFNDNRMTTTTTMASAKSTKSIVDADLLKKIGAKLNQHSGKAISSRSLLTKIEEVLREELPLRVHEAKKEGRSLRSLGNPPRSEKDDARSIDAKRATLKLFTDAQPNSVAEQTVTVSAVSPSKTTVTATSAKPKFSFRIMEERPTTQPVKQIPV